MRTARMQGRSLQGNRRDENTQPLPCEGTTETSTKAVPGKDAWMKSSPAWVTPGIEKMLASDPALAGTDGRDRSTEKASPFWESETDTYG